MRRALSTFIRDAYRVATKPMKTGTGLLGIFGLILALILYDYASQGGDRAFAELPRRAAIAILIAAVFLFKKRRKPHVQ